MEKPAALDALFAPRGIAVIGATPEPGRVGGRTIAVLRMAGYRGAIYAVHPKHENIDDIPCFKSVEDVPDPVDLAIITLGAARVPEAVRACGRRAISAAVVFADGFTADEMSDLDRAVEEAREASGLRLVGPNTVGIRRIDNGCFATFASDVVGPERAGGVAMIAQSGGLAVYFGSALLQGRGLNARYVIDTGRELDVDAADCIAYVADDPAVTCIAVLIEGCRDGRRLGREVARAVARGIPVVFMKTGRSQAGMQQVASHTGALAGSSLLFDAALREAGAYVTCDDGEFMDAIVLSASGKVPKGRRLGVVTPSGGYGIMTLDAAEEYGMQVPSPARPPSAEEKADLAFGSFGNPLDFSSTISAGPNAVETSLRWMASQPNIDAVLLWQAYSVLRKDRQDALYPAVERLVSAFDKPLLCCGLTTADFQERLRKLGVLWFEEPSRVVRALSIVAPREKISIAPASSQPAAAPPAANVVTGSRARDLLSLPRLPQVKTEMVASAEEACRACKKIGDRVILKVESERHAHKTELGLVTGPLSQGEVAAAYEALVKARAASDDPQAPIVLQPFVRGVELALGAYRDSVFGPAVMVAIGGIFTELLKDTAFAPAPVSVEAARQMILGLKGAKILTGARGRPLCDVDAAAAALADLSEFIAAKSDIYSEIDINPLLVLPAGQGVVAVDALLVPSPGDSDE
jgi:acyl-CoA synthetase (NDP forming)